MGDASSTAPENYFMVGAYWSDHDPADQTARFLRDGVWENGVSDNEKEADAVRGMRPGDRIAIKASGIQKADLPFDAGGKTVSRLLIKAIGTISDNPGDGKRVSVKWDAAPAIPRRWYYYTYRGTIWRLRKGNEYADKLIEFAFSGAEQDVEWFRERWAASASAASHETQQVSADELSLEVDEPVAEEVSSIQLYGVDDILADGAFLDAEELEQILDRWGSKKNLILQGAPGVGKSFLARRLAYALMQERDVNRIGMVQFHQSYSYDDFVRGYRPGPTGGFALQDGVFLRFCIAAANDPDPLRPWVFIIDEMNRGNLAQIFGELLLLIESDKRSNEYAVPLVYRTDKDKDERFHVPPNIYIVGLMNIADRSLAIVDYALRRRFSFVTLQPRYGNVAFRDWLSQRKMSNALIDLIVDRLTSLNNRIAEDKLLGPPYQIGHSFFCPRGDDFTGLGREWYDRIVETEIRPLLEEYWFDDAAKVSSAVEELCRP